MKFVPLDVNFLSDSKIKILKARYGADGLMILIDILSRIYREGYYTKVDEDFSFVIGDELGVSPDKVEQVMTFLLKRSMFDEQLFKSDAILTSAGIQERWQTAMKTRADKKVPRIVVPEFWLLDHEHTETWINLGERGNYTHSENTSEIYNNKSEIYDDKSEIYTTSKSNRSKSNNTITITPVSEPETGTPAQRAEITQEDVINYCRSRNLKTNPIKFFEYYSKLGWKTKGGEKITNWYSLAEDWDKKEITEPTKPPDGSFDTDDFFSAALKRNYGGEE